MCCAASRGKMRGIIFALIAVWCFSQTALSAEMITRQSKMDWKTIWNKNYETMGQAVMAGDYAWLDQHYNGVQKAFESGAMDEYVLQWEFDIFEDIFKHQPSHAYLEKWVEKSPNSYAANLVVGLMHLSYGHQLRGTKYANETTPEQFAGMEREYTRAAPYLLKSLTLAERPVLSYEAILNTFRNASVAMAAFAPKPNANLAGRDITVGEAFAGSLQELATVLGVGQEPPRNYTDAQLHLAMWHYARQGFAVAPKSDIIADTYYDLIKPKWYGSEEMMRAFAEKMYQGGVIEKWRYQRMMYNIPLDRALFYGKKQSKNYDPLKAAGFYLEALQYVDDKETDNIWYYYDAIYWYLKMHKNVAETRPLTTEEIEKIKPYLDQFLSSNRNPYLTTPLKSDNKQRLDEIQKLRHMLG